MATILIVDDEPAIATLLERSLSNTHNVITAVKAEDALKDHFFDIAIVDVMMPEMNGPDLVKKLRVRHPHMKLLFMSGAVSVPLPRPCCVIQKPFNIMAVMEAVDNIDAVLQGVKKIPGIVRLE